MVLSPIKRKTVGYNNEYRIIDTEVLGKRDGSSYGPFVSGKRKETKSRSPYRGTVKFVVRVPRVILRLFTDGCSNVPPPL